MTASTPTPAYTIVLIHLSPFSSANAVSSSKRLQNSRSSARAPFLTATSVPPPQTNISSSFADGNATRLVLPAECLTTSLDEPDKSEVPRPPRTMLEHPQTPHSHVRHPPATLQRNLTMVSPLSVSLHRALPASLPVFLDPVGHAELPSAQVALAIWHTRSALVAVSSLIDRMDLHALPRILSESSARNDAEE